MAVKSEILLESDSSQSIHEVCGFRLGERPIDELLSAATCRIKGLKGVLNNPLGARDFTEAGKRRILLQETRRSAEVAIELSSELNPVEKLTRMRALRKV